MEELALSLDIYFSDTPIPQYSPVIRPIEINHQTMDQKERNPDTFYCFNTNKRVNFCLLPSNDEGLIDVNNIFILTIG